MLSSYRGMIMNAIRMFFASIDTAIYFFVSVLSRVIFDIADYPISEEIIGDFKSRVYLLLAIFMLFKITISLFSYLINPDGISDREKGAGKLVTRIMVTMIMLLFLPRAFLLMSEIQQPLLNTIPRILLGTETNGVEQLDTASNSMSTEVLRAFVTPNTSCNHQAEKINGVFINVIINNSCDDDFSKYSYDYHLFLATAAGAFMLYVLLGIAITIGVRMFKLIILEMIAPIAIISYIDPKSEKNGTFSSWMKAIISTWLELFINLGIMYLVIYVINNVITNGEFVSYATNLGPVRGAFFTAFFILGLLMFARQAPKFIMDSLGIKGGGSFGQALGLSAATLGIAGAGISSYQASRAADDALGRDHNFFRNAGAALFGGASGAFTGMSAAMDAKDHNSRAVREAMAKRNARARELGAQGGTFFGAVGSELGQFFTGQNPSDVLEAQWKTEEQQIAAAETALKNVKDTNSHRKAIMDRVKSKAADAEWTSGTYRGITGNAREFNSVFTAALNSGTGVYQNAAGEDVFDFNGQEVHLNEGQSILQGLTDEGEKDYYYQTTHGLQHDDVIDSEMALLQASGGVVEDNLGAMKGTAGRTNAYISSESDNINRRRTALNEAKSSEQAQAAQANAKRFKGQ